MEKLTKKQKLNLARITIAIVLFATVVIVEKIIDDSWLLLILYLIPYAIVGYDVIRKCVLGISHGQMFDESFLMTLATIGAFGCKEFAEAVAVMLFYQVGEFFQNYAVGKSRNAIKELMSIAPDYANRELEDGTVEVIDPDEVNVGDILVVKPGEKIPVDAIVIDGAGYINTSSLTGESMPQYVKTGDDIISGCINCDNLIKIQASKLYDDSTVSQILELVENAANKKSKTEAFITRFAKYYTPIVVIAGAILAFVPPIFFGNFSMWILRACTFLVISCPCALVISVPLAFFGGIGAASKIGVLVKGSNYLEMMSSLDTLVADKTGTLTEGKFAVSMIDAAPGYSTDDVIQCAAAIESGSTHPIARAIVNACKKSVDANRIKNIENIAGKGIRGIVGHNTIIVGNKSLLIELGVDTSMISNDAVGTVVYVAKNNKYIGTIEVSDKLKIGTKKAIDDIIKEQVKHIIMLTGDTEKSASKVAAELGNIEYRAGLLPQNKVFEVEQLLGKISDSKRYLAFVGDGINDAPVLTRADIGIAMGSLGSDAAIEAADIVIMDDNIEKIPMLIRIARKTVSTSKSNIAFALLVKITCLILGALGIANMWVAVFADVGVAMICILNSMRMLIANKEKK